MERRTSHGVSRILREIVGWHATLLSDMVIVPWQCIHEDVNTTKPMIMWSNNENHGLAWKMYNIGRVE